MRTPATTARNVSVLFLCLLLFAAQAVAVSKVKLRGYITAHPDPQTITILNDVIHLSAPSRIWRLAC